MEISEDLGLLREINVFSSFPGWCEPGEAVPQWRVSSGLATERVTLPVDSLPFKTCQ